MGQLMDKDVIGGTSSTRVNWNSPGLTQLRLCSLITSRYQILLWSILHLGLSIQFTAGVTMILICIHALISMLNIFCCSYHPCLYSDIIIQGLTILAPIDSPNTDGINPGDLYNSFIIIINRRWTQWLSREKFSITTKQYWCYAKFSHCLTMSSF